ncbi:MAG: mechanosensitive ion channel [Candidatus Lokiarchaeota archaeon]|nr:mechanosensitive ion channel [Candidatus Lokiarchaeota archaeon]
MLLQVPTFLSKIWEWLVDDGSYNNLIKISVSLFLLLLYFFAKRFVIIPQLKKAEQRGKLDKTARISIQKIIRFVFLVIYIILLFTFFFSEASGVVTGIFAFSGATIIGFASMNTIGNAIAGLIIMISKPFKVGDRIRYKDKLANVVMIRFVFTKLRFLDNTEISVPNQEFLNSGVVNLGQKTHITTRSIVFGLDYKIDPNKIIEEVTKLVLENPDIEKPSKQYDQTSGSSSKILDSISKITFESPEEELNLNPSVKITNFLDYAVEYTLFFKARVDKGYKAETDIRKSLLIWANDHEYDLSTTMQIKNM